MRQRVLTTSVLLAILLANGAAAQQCDDFDACTVNDMCLGGECIGSFETGASCDDFNACTINDRCVMDPFLGPVCRGTNAPQGTTCGGGCGTCLPVIGSPQLIVCGGDPADHGAPCDLGINPCTVGSCVIVNTLASCVPRLKDCPDTDGNPCTDFCDVATGECRPDVPKCVPFCEACNRTTGACEPANLLMACDDGDLCTPQTRCQFNDQARRTFCVAGVPVGPSPTRTVIPSTPTASRTPTAPATATRSFTGTRTHTATAQPTNTRPSTATPTATSTVPPTVPQPTFTATFTARPISSATATPVQPATASAAATATVTPTLGLSPTPGTCVGDCDISGDVFVNEIILGVRIALGQDPLSACVQFDRDASGEVEVYELIGGVKALLEGCG